MGDEILKSFPFSINRRMISVGLAAIFILIILLGYKPLLRCIYPIHFMDRISAHSDNAELDPYLIAAVISVESSFNPNVVSPKGAIGLMQILPNTGLWVAKHLGYDDFKTDQLYDPDTNISIGIWYLTHLMKEFDSDIIVALACYNGGETNVRQWLSNGTWSGSIDDIKHIPFPETRKYVRKVLAMYEYYKWLY